MTEQNNATIPFEDAGLAHHAMVGKAPDDSSTTYRFAVAAGNKIVSAGAVILVGAELISGGKSRLSMDLD
ncbi:MAG: hypothetical protein AAF204_02975 [Pseudomonadota bacterium]